MNANNNVTASPPLTPAAIAVVLPPTEVGSEDSVVVGVTLSAGKVVVGVVMPVMEEDDTVVGVTLSAEEVVVGVRLSAVEGGETGINEVVMSVMDVSMLLVVEESAVVL